MPDYTKRQLRRSQAVSTFGPGAIIDLRQESVMMLGTNLWPQDRGVDIHEPNLERLLGVEHFRMPGTGDGIAGAGRKSKDLPITRFPRWLACPACNRLGPLHLFSGMLEGNSGALRCPDCHKVLYPARFIVACRNGHIDDFPWEWWAHRETKSGRPCEHPALWLEAMGVTAALGDLRLSCTGCKAHTTLAGALEAKQFEHMTCSGRRPWLGDREQCDEKVIPLQRGASNVYFPALASTISIPPWSRAIQVALNPYWAALKNVPADRLETVVQDLNLAAVLHRKESDLVQAIRDRLNATSSESTVVSELELRYQESEALRQTEIGADDADAHDFLIRDTAIHSVLQPLLTKVVRVERLREVRALLGFTRVEGPDPTDRIHGKLARLSSSLLPWLPAVEVHGEGIYIELDEKHLEAWQDHDAGVKERAGLLQKQYNAMSRARGWQGRLITPRLLLVHSLAHALIRQLSIDSGYSSAAIRERLYAFEPDAVFAGSSARAGVLIYTSTADSEGSLGGLMRQGLPDRLVNTIRLAMLDAAWCSSDPLCIESSGQGHERLNLAACHACMLLSETCCEEFNRILDRATLTGTPLKPGMGYFSGLLE